MNQDKTKNPSILFLHGLFGSADNLKKLAQAFTDYPLFLIDLRNHGLSPWRDAMDYRVMSQDVQHFIARHCQQAPMIVGHSMGGKVAMQLAKSSPELIERLIVLDIAPAIYPLSWHQKVFEILSALKSETNKIKVRAQLEAHFPVETAHFLMKSYKTDHWLFNLKAILAHHQAICDWEDEGAIYVPALFLKGDRSPYINEENESLILSQFPLSQIEQIANAGHNVHLEQPAQVSCAIKNWLET